MVMVLDSQSSSDDFHRKNRKNKLPEYNLRSGNSKLVVVNAECEI